MPLHCLARIRPLHKATGTRIDIHVSSASLRQITGLNGVVWEPAMVAAPVLNMRLFNGDFQAAVEPGSASLPINMTALKQSYPTADACAWSAAPVDIWAGEAGQAWPWTQVFSGKVSGWNRRGQVLSLSAETAFDDKNVLTGTYAGTGGAEGSLDLKGKVKPLALGWPQNVEPVLINAVDSVYQFSAYGPIEAVTKLYERGSDFGASIGDYANYTALVAASIPPGRWATCLAQGMIRLGAPAFGVITGDLKGHKVGASAPRLTGAIINALATISGTSSAFIESASLTALDAAAPYPVSAMITDQVKFSDAAKGLALPCNWQAGISLLGKFFVMPVTLAGSPALTLDSRGRSLPQVIESAEQDVSPPYFKTILGAAQSWRVHTADEISFTASLILRGEYVPGKAYREGHIVTSADGSAWLYVNPVASSGNAPPSWPTTSNAYWENHTPPLSSTALKYGDGTPIESLKPAQVGATVGAISGVNLRNNADTAYLGDPDIITAAGTAAAIAGQGPLATAPSASPYVNANITIGANGALSGAGGGTVTISGLGYTGALNATFGARVGTNLRNSSDTAYLGDADVITSAGTAAAIAGQGSLATKSAVDLASAEVTNKSLANLDGTANTKLGGIEAGATVGGVFGTNLRETAGGTIATLAAFKTSSGTAAAITGQGPGATAAASAVMNYAVGLGQNVLTNSAFENGSYGWEPGWDNYASFTPEHGVGLPGYSGALSTAYTRVLGTPPAGVFDSYNPSGGNPKRWWLPVSGGDRVFASALVAYHRLAYAPDLKVGWYDASGVYLTESVVATGGRNNGANGGEPANFDRVGGFLLAPANARYARIWIRGATDGGQTDPYLFYTQMMLCRVPADQTAWPVYHDGGADLFANVTGENTAAAIAGQGPLATAPSASPYVNANISIGANGALIGAGGGSVTIGGLGYLGDLDATRGARVGLNLRNSADTAYLGDADVITAAGTAAAIAGQGALATQSSLAYGGAYLTGFGGLAGLASVNFGSSTLLETSGGAQATLGNFKTALGTAAAFTGQSAWATYSGLVPSNVAGQVQYLQTDGYLQALRVYKPGVAFLNDVWPAEAGANVTESRTAAAISGQGPFATTPLPVSRLTMIKPNLFPYPFGVDDGRNAAQIGWSNTAATAGFSEFGMGRNAYFDGGYYQTYRSSGAAATLYPYYDMAWDGGSAAVSVGLNGHCSNGTFYPYVEFVNAAKNAVLGGFALTYNTSTERYEANGVTPPASTAFIRVVASGSFSATSGTYQDIVCWGIKIERGPNATPLMETPRQRVSGDQVEWATGGKLNALRPAEFGANVTESRAAAAIAGQGYFATQNYAGASRLLVSGYDNIIPDGDYRDPSWWGFSGLPNVGFLAMDSYWEQSRALSFTCDRDFDFYSSYFNIEPGSVYRVRTRIWNNDAGAGWTGDFWALIHMPNVAWWSLKHGAPVNSDVGGSANAISAIGDTGVQEFYFRATSNTMRNIQFRFKSTARGSRVDLQVMISKVPQLGKDLIKSGTATKYLVSEIETGLGTAAAIAGQGAGATANNLAQLDAAAAAQLTTAYNGGVQSAAYGETIKRKIGPGGTLALSALVNCAAGGVSGSIRARIESRPYGGSWSTVATGAGSATGPSEPGGDSTSGTFTNSTGVEQVFEFRVIEVRTPSGAGGSILASQSYVTG